MTGIVEQITKNYDTNRDYVTAILNLKGLLEVAEQAADLDDFIKQAGDSYKYISYALNTNMRGFNSLSRMLALATPKAGGRALDVGCGYGGFMNAFAKKGFKPFGVEIDPRLADLAKINLKDSSFDFEIYVGDLFKGEVKIESYDLITVNDVLEHLSDPIAAFDQLASMLNPKGVLAIYAPNGQSIFNVTSDPHNRVLGSSSMPGMLAKTYVQAALSLSGYGLGEYLGLSTIRDLCHKNGLSFRYASHDGGERPERAIAYLKKLIDRFAETDFGSKCSPILAREVEAHMWNYVAKYSKSAAKAICGDGYLYFNDEYLARAWTICCFKE
jgi:2-polyprenyl-3-methyl-5-hydroxy-6-metoxy-1,4-benzoquinol methylase